MRSAVGVDDDRKEHIIGSQPTIAEREIFAAAAALTPAERSAYLDDACAGQEEMRARIEELLRTHESSEFMEAADWGELTSWRR